MRIKLLLTALIVISIVLGNVLGGGTPIFALRGIWNEAQEDDIDDDNLVIEEDEDYAGEEFEKINDEDLQDALETPVDEVEDEDEEEDEEDGDKE